VSTPQHPLDDNGGDYIVDVVSIAGIVSSLLQVVLALVGPEKAKAALDWESVQAANVAADATKAATDAAALAILASRGVK
jgi:hypothetical protein